MTEAKTRMHTVTTTPRERHRIRNTIDSYQSESTRRVKALTAQTLGDDKVIQSLFFSTGVVDRIERQLQYGLTIVGDSKLIDTALEPTLLSRFPVDVECFIDLPIVNAIAQQKRITRAEVAIEQALNVTGPKLIVIGSAPMALHRLLEAHAVAPLHDVALIAACSGFAGAVELKERLWESRLPSIVVRGRKGGVNVATALLNALLYDAAQQPPVQA